MNLPINRFTESKRWYLLGIILAIITGVFYVLNLHPGHDWGSDFSQYIAHARNIVEGIPYKATGHIQNPDNSIAPEVYPAVFPLLLAPVYAFYGVNIIAFKAVVVVCFVGFLLLVPFVFRNKVPAFIVFLITALLALNPNFYLFKENILSEFPFMFFLFLCFFHMEKAFQVENTSQAWLYFALVGLGIFLVIGCRSAGIVLIPAWIGHYIFKKNKPDKWLVYVGLSLLVFGIFYLAQKVYLNSAGESYTDQWVKKYHAGTISFNLTNYFEEAKLLWVEGANNSIKLFLITLLLVLAGSGILLKIKRSGITVYELFTAGYLVLTLIWPWFQGFRMLIPLVPLCLFYSFYFINQINRKGILFPFIASAILFLIWFVPYFRSYKKIDANPPGNFIRTDTNEMLDFIRLTPSEARVLFIKPRIIALFTEHSAIVPHCPTNINSFGPFLQKYKVRYIVLSKKEFVEETKCLKTWVDKHPQNARLTFQNEGYKIYKLAD